MGAYKIVEYPLNSSAKSIPVKKGLAEFEKKRIVNASFERLLIASDGKGNMSIKIATYLPDESYLKRHNYDASSNTITKISPDFDGRIIITSWDGKFVNGLKYKNGKIINRMTGNMTRKTEDYILTIKDKPQEASKKSTNSFNIEKKSSAGSQTCTWTYEDVYSVTSAGHMVGDVLVIDEITITYEGTENWEFQGCVDDETNEPVTPDPEAILDPCFFGFCDGWEYTGSEETEESELSKNVRLCQQFNWSTIGNSYYAEANNLSWLGQRILNGKLASLGITWTKSCIQIPGYNIANNAAANTIINNAFNSATDQLIRDLDSNAWWSSPLLAKGRLKWLINHYLNIKVAGSTFSSDACDGNVSTTTINANSYCE